MLRSEYLKRKKAYRIANKDRINAYMKIYTIANKGEIKEYQENYRKTHKPSSKLYNKEYSVRNKSIKKENARLYYLKNRKRIIEFATKYHIDNKDYYRKYSREWQQNRRTTDPIFRLNCSIRRSIYDSLKGNKQGKHWETLVNFTLNEIKNTLEKQFKKGMSWDNYGKWHIDHIKPVSAFNIVNIKDKEFKDCWTLSNLQPLWAIDNLRKGGANRVKDLSHLL